jgi:hypothetical protein
LKIRRFQTLEKKFFFDLFKALHFSKIFSNFSPQNLLSGSIIRISDLQIADFYFVEVTYIFLKYIYGLVKNAKLNASMSSFYERLGFENCENSCSLWMKMFFMRFLNFSEKILGFSGNNFWVNKKFALKWENSPIINKFNKLFGPFSCDCHANVRQALTRKIRKLFQWEFLMKN